jgi:hypothetical protein
MSHLESITRTALTVTRQVLRPPLTALDDRVVLPRLGSRSPVHHALTAAVGLLDTLAPDGDASDADASDGGASDGGAPGAGARVPTPGPSAPPMPPEEQEAVADLTDELLADQRDDRFTGELADEELRRVQAQVRAKQLIEDPEHP